MLIPGASAEPSSSPHTRGSTLLPGSSRHSYFPDALMSTEHHTKGGAERVLFVLATLGRMGRSVSINDLMLETGLAKSTLYRQLALLKRWGFIIDNNNEFLPGPMCVSLAWGFEQSYHLRQEARAELEQLSSISNESAGLLVAVNRQVVCLEMIETRQPLRCSFVKGRSLPLTRGASAKALLAFMAKDRQATVLSELQDDEILDADARQALETELGLIHARGYACTDSEVDDGVWGVSAPIFQHHRRSIAVVTLMAPNTRIENRATSLIDMTVRVASRISSRLQSL